MVLRAFKSQPYVTRTLLNAINHDQLAHAYLFVGPKGIGKRDVAQRLAQALNCEEPQDGDACGQCRACHKIENGNHPDVQLIERDGSSIGIDQVRDGIVRDVAYRPYEGQKRVIVIDEAETMTPEAANSLLKVLEEPPNYVTILMLTDHPQVLLPTIRSRVQSISFREVARDLIVPELVGEYGLSRQRAAFFAALARGNPGQAHELAQSETLLEDRKTALSMLHELAKSTDDVEVFAMAEDLSDKGQRLDQFFDLLIALLRDIELVLLNADPGQLVNQDLSEELRQLGDILPAGAVGVILRLTQDTLRTLEARANRLLTCEVFLLKVRRVLKGELDMDRAYLIPSYVKS